MDEKIKWNESRREGSHAIYKKLIAECIASLNVAGPWIKRSQVVELT